MGHAGAIISGGEGTAEGKVEALRRAGVKVVDSPADMGAAMLALLQRRKGKAKVKPKGRPVKKAAKKAAKRGKKK